MALLTRTERITRTSVQIAAIDAAVEQQAAPPAAPSPPVIPLLTLDAANDTYQVSAPPVSAARALVMQITLHQILAQYEVLLNELNARLAEFDSTVASTPRAARAGLRRFTLTPPSSDRERHPPFNCVHSTCILLSRHQRVPPNLLTYSIFSADSLISFNKSHHIK